MSFLPKFPTPYEEAWNKLFDAVMRRNRWMEELSDMVAAAKNVSPAQECIALFDTAEARRILDEIDAATPPVVEALEAFNAERKKISRPPLTWQNYDLRPLLPKRKVVKKQSWEKK